MTLAQYSKLQVSYDEHRRQNRKELDFGDDGSALAKLDDRAADFSNLVNGLAKVLC